MRGNKKVDKQTMLLLVGNQGPETPAIRLLIKRLELEESVRLVEKVSDGELRWLYDHCECLIAPSFTEGFGLPVVEGLVCKRRLFVRILLPLERLAGMPVITSIYMRSLLLQPWSRRCMRLYPRRSRRQRIWNDSLLRESLKNTRHFIDNSERIARTSQEAVEIAKVGGDWAG